MHYNDYNRNEFLPVPAPAAQTEAAAPKKHTGRLVALALVCALLGGVAGGAAVRYIPALASRTTLYEGSHAPTVVSISNVTTEQPLTLPQIYASNLNSTVGITTELVTTNYWGQQVKGAAAGSGFVISQDGYILTNYHVIEGATAIQVAFADGRTYDATLVGGESPNDIAVLKIEAEDLTPVVLGDSDNLVVGEQVCAIGNPLGELTYTLTAGYVSARDRSITMSDGTVMNMLQTDTAINSGNSGGPLFNMYGQVIGITTAKYSGTSGSSATIEGIGFAIPINDVIGIITDYMQYGYVTGRPYMGILEPRNISDYAQTFGWPIGVYVTGIDEDSCAQKAGLKPGDIITKIDDTEITDVNQMISVKNGYRAGDTVTLEVYRSGETITLSLTFDEQSNATTQGSSGNQGQVIPNNPAPQPTASGNNPGQYPYGDQNPYGGEEYEDFFNSFPWNYFFGR